MLMKKTEQNIVNEMQAPEDIIIERSNFRDEQVKKRNREQDEKEEMYRIQKQESEANLIRTKSSKRRKKKKSSSEMNNKVKLPSNLKYIPENIKQFTGNDDLILSIDADGSCGIKSGAAHIFEDQNQG